MDDPSEILILEDSAMMRSVYRMVLERPGVRLHFATDGLEGLDVAAVEPGIDLFIVDVNLPRMDGIEYIRRIRSELGRSEPPILVVSTECDPVDQDAAYAAGADGYLCKPWEPDELADAIATLSRREETP